MDGQRTIAVGEDPVCATSVDPDEPARHGLRARHEGVEYAFCSRACLSAFRDDPAWFLDPAYIATSTTGGPGGLPED